MKQFEYKMLYEMHSTTLSSLGREGWELVSHTYSKHPGYSPTETWVFKREITRIEL